jgi:hypothetical protein
MGEDLDRGKLRAVGHGRKSTSFALKGELNPQAESPHRDGR